MNIEAGGLLFRKRFILEKYLENVCKKKKKIEKRKLVHAFGSPAEEGEAETLIKDKRLCLSPFFCVSQQLLHPPLPFSHLLQWQAHSLTLCSMPAAWETAVQPPLRGTHTHTHQHDPHACICVFCIFWHKYT